MGSATVLVVANLQVASGLRRMQATREREMTTRYVIQAAEAKFASRALSAPQFATTSTTVTVSGVVYDLSFLKIDGTSEVDVEVSRNGTVLTTVRTIDPRALGRQLYGLHTNDFEMDKRLVLGNSVTPTHAFFGKKPKNAAVSGSFIHGSIDAEESNVRYPSSGPVDTNQRWSDPPKCAQLLWFPNEATLSNATISGRNVSGYTSGPSYLIYCGDRATVTGTFKGRITIYSKGKATLKTPINVTPGSTLVVMSDEDVEVDGQGLIDCHLYTSGKLTIPSQSAPINWTGSIVAKQILCGAPLNLTLDPFFYGDPDRYEEFYVPRG